MLASLILLHITSTVAPVTTIVDPVLSLCALIAFAVAASAVWLPGSPFSPRTLRHRRGRRRVAAGAVTALVFLALLPSVVPYDHLLTQDAHADGADNAVHAAHCHISPGTCADAPVTAGLGQLLLSEPLVPAPAMLAVVVAPATTILVGIAYRPETPPPLRTAA